MSAPPHRIWETHVPVTRRTPDDALDSLLLASVAAAAHERGGPDPASNTLLQGRTRPARPRVSVIVVAYRAGEALDRCLDSLERQDVPLETLVVANGAAEDEIDRAAGRQDVRVVDLGRNAGFAAGCNAGAAQARGHVLVFLNPDAVAADGAIDLLAETVSDPDVGVAMARVRLLDSPTLLNTRGNVLHVAGFAWVGGLGEPVETADAGEPVDVPSASGAALAVRAETFRALGGFTDELFLYGEDVELAWRARLQGLRVVMDPRADVFHDYEFTRNDEKRYFLERNRLVFVLSSFSPRLLALLGPLLVAAEVAVSLLALQEGWLKEKARGWAWCLRHARWLRRHRRATQKLRRVADRDLAGVLTPTFDPAAITLPAFVGPANRLLGLYWRLARKAL
jgi:GT2 family glycosyltransferase